MPNHPSYTNPEIAEIFRHLAESISGPEKKRFLKIAGMYDRQSGLVAGSLRAIAESKLLLAQTR